MGKVMVIDLAICNGCHNCQVSCKDEHVANDWSPIAKPQPDTGQFWNKVIRHGAGYRAQGEGHLPPLHLPALRECPLHGRLSRRTPSTSAPTASSSSTRIDAGATSSAWKPARTRTSSTSTTISTSPRSAPSARISSTRAGPRPVALTPVPPGPSPSGRRRTYKSVIAKAELLKPELATRPRVYYLNLPKKWIAGEVFD